MKNLVLFVITICIMALGACKKDATTKKTTTSSDVPSDGWKLGTTSYKEAIGARTTTNTGGVTVVDIVAFDAIPTGSDPNVNTFQAVFLTAPTANGTYHVAKFPNTTPLAANECGITAAGPAGSYTSTGSGSVDITVTVTGGKVKAVVPTVEVKKTTSADLLNVTGTIVEN